MRLTGARVVIQRHISPKYLCEGFAGVPSAAPAHVVVEHVDSVQAAADAERLYHALVGSIRGGSAAAAHCGMPCGGRISSPARCHAMSEPDCRHVLVVVGDGVTPGASSARLVQLLTAWRTLQKRGLVIPVVQSGKNVSTVLPPGWSHANGGSWLRTPAELSPRVLASAGIVPQEFRVFLSYRRQEASALADQLFDALAHRNFDVFLDRFRMDPGVDFEARLEDELIDRSMVVVLESAGILTSPWTRLEVAFARRHRLGLFAVHMPGGVRVPGIGNRRRIVVRTDGRGEVGARRLDEVVRRVEAEHARAMMRRAGLLADSMRDALLLEKLPPPGTGPEGLLIASSPSGSFSIALCPRPPRVDDFRRTHAAAAASSTRGLVIGPTLLRDDERRGQIDWLAGVSTLRCFDEGSIRDVARRIARGTL